MRRVGGLMDAVVSFPNLVLAYRKAAKGKRSRGSVSRFFRDLEPELLRLSSEMTGGSYRPGGFRTFIVNDPKRRLISMPPFRDRVVHHAIVNALEPVLEARFDPDSYGCRKGRGMDRALGRAREFAGRHPWCLKADVRKFYESIDPDVLLGLLRRIVKDRSLLALLERIVRAGAPGLPIGSLTSQWLANLYLTPLDRWLREHRAARGQVRYMDDVLAFGAAQDDLKDLLSELKGFLEGELCLTVKESATRIHRTRSGVPFLGFRVLPGHLEIRRETWRRFRSGVRRVEREYRLGRLSIDGLAGSVGSRLAHVKRARSRALRRKEFEPGQSMEW